MREKDTPTLGFTPQMAARGKAGPDENQEPGTPSGLHIDVFGSWTAFPSTA